MHFAACSGMVDPTITGKVCIYSNNECKERIYDCNSYKGSKASECEAIVPLKVPLNEKCVFKNNKCQSEKITSCEQFNPLLQKELCNHLELENGVKCHLVNNECKEYFTECSDYTGNNENTCESIELNYPFYHCRYMGDSTCMSESNEGLTCDSYSSDLDEFYCQNIEHTDFKKHCVFYNNKCTEYYERCSDLDGTDENVCNSNIPNPYSSYDYKCVYKNGKCIEEKKTCSDYKEGEDYNYCEDIYLDHTNTECKIINGQCKEVEIYDCESYKGTDENECISITPYKHFKKKCVYKDGKCQRGIKNSCSDYIEGDESYWCYYINPSDRNKYCRFTGSKCIEEYKQCSYYTGKDEKVCNSIIGKYGQKCEFKNNECVNKTMKCSDYTSLLDVYDAECSRIPLSNKYKKCSYSFSNHQCTLEDKYCEEFTYGATKRICEKAPTSSKKKKCVLSTEKNACVEKDGSNLVKIFQNLSFLLLFLLID